MNCRGESADEANAVVVGTEVACALVRSAVSVALSGVICDGATGIERGDRPFASLPEFGSSSLRVGNRRGVGGAASFWRGLAGCTDALMGTEGAGALMAVTVGVVAVVEFALLSVVVVVVVVVVVAAVDATAGNDRGDKPLAFIPVLASGVPRPGTKRLGVARGLSSRRGLAGDDGAPEDGMPLRGELACARGSPGMPGNNCGFCPGVPRSGDADV